MQEECLTKTNILLECAGQAARFYSAGGHANS